MFVWYLGRRIGHSGNTTEIETPIVPNEETDDILTNQSEEGLNKQFDDGCGKEDDDEVTSENEDEDALDGKHVEYGEEDIENEYSDDEELDAGA